MEPQISVVIITLNEENYLPRLLEDLAGQTDKRFEVLIVDANSTDRTKERALEYQKRLQLHFIESPKGQVSYQRNLGAQKAKSDYYFFLDADSQIEPQVIEKILMHINKDHKLLYLPTIKPSINTFSNRLLFAACVEAVKFLHLVKRPLSLGPLIVIHKSLFEKVKGYDEEVAIAEDHNIVIKSVKTGIKATFLPDVPVIYSMRRFESRGKWKLMREYALYTSITLLKGGVYENKKNYVMGGQQYKDGK